MQTEPIRNKKHIRAMTDYYLKQGKLRNYLLILMGGYTGLRISDLLCLTKADVYDFTSHKFRTHIRIVERKTGKQKAIAINKKVLAALYFFDFQDNNRDDFLFQSKRKKRAAIGRTQAWRIIKEAAVVVGIPGCISCHSLRKTLGYHSWKAGVSPVLLMDIFNHSSFVVTQRYWGIAQDDRDKAYLNLILL
jgi:Site-specific recombinase XerD